MDAVLLIAIVVVLAIVVPFVLDRAKGFRDPGGMSDQEILSAIAGQADWLEKQFRHSSQFGGTEPHAQIARNRRDYVFRLSEALVARHPEPMSLLYSATQRAKQLEVEGKPHVEAVVSAVKEQVFAANGHVYLAKWHN